VGLRDGLCNVFSVLSLANGLQGSEGCSFSVVELDAAGIECLAVRPRQLTLGLYQFSETKVIK
jgi:hypothetical protein